MTREKYLMDEKAWAAAARAKAAHGELRAAAHEAENARAEWWEDQSAALARVARATAEWAAAEAVDAMWEGVDRKVVWKAAAWAAGIYDPAKYLQWAVEATWDEESKRQG